MWILGLILAGVVTSLIVMLIKGDLRLVLAVLGVICYAIISAAGLVLSGVGRWLGSLREKVNARCKDQGRGTEDCSRRPLSRSLSPD